MQRPGRYVLDAHCQPVEEPDLFKWAEWFEDKRNRRVVWTKLGWCVVSTIFLGLDHNFTLAGPPVLWETMVLSNDPRYSGDMRRYSSLEAAIRGHQATVEACERKRRQFYRRLR